jgi:hypothetical protein
MELLTIATYGTTLEADLARIRLEGRGIACWILGDQLGSLFASTGVSAIRLQVRETDSEEALRILASPPGEDEQAE